MCLPANEEENGQDTPSKTERAAIAPRNANELNLAGLRTYEGPKAGRIAFPRDRSG